MFIACEGYARGVAVAAATWYPVCANELCH